MKKLLLLPLLTLITLPMSAQVNYDEAKVPAYQLPELLSTEDGQEIQNSLDWALVRRPELLHLFATEVYGQTPLTTASVRWELVEQSDQALGGKAIRKQVRIWLENADALLAMDLLVYLPKQDQPAPLFLGLNFYGNHTIHADPNIRLTESWVRNNGDFGIAENKATEASRGVRANRWSVEAMLARGYGLATMYYGDIDPDFDDDFQNGIHPYFYEDWQRKPTPSQWGSIGAWSWGLSRAMDYLQTDTQVDRNRVILMGHSRLGKTSLWAGAQDERFAMVISNNSGCGGAAISRRRFGEKVQRINTSFPHWFCDNFNHYNEREDQLPVDSHQLIALMAPRPVYVASATEDRWADPRGEFLAAKHATAVFELYGLKGLEAEDIPAPDSPLQEGYIGYHLRTGKHDVTLYDWQRYMDFADKHLSSSVK
jgi:hypothetical protein